MKIDGATVVITVAAILAALAISGAIWDISLDMEQAARIKRLETAMRSLCGPQSPNHHIEACAELSLPLEHTPNPFASFND